MRRVFICIPCFGLLCCSYCADLQKDCRMVVLTKLSDMCTCLALAKPVCVSVFVSLCFIEFAYICTINGEFAAVSSIFVCVCVCMEHIRLLRTCVCSLALFGCSLLHAWHDGDLMFVVEYKIKQRTFQFQCSTLWSWRLSDCVYF